jgi:addiction module RelE/StbE family toxin
MKKSASPQNFRISKEYQKELEIIRDEVKKGDCSTLKECLILFEELWYENHPENLLFSNKALKKIEKLTHEDPEQYSHVVKKIKQIKKKPQHYKPLRGDFHGARRVHIGDFVLIYQLEKKNIIIQDYNHHDKVYE